MNRNSWLALPLGVVIGVIATLVYWRSGQERSKFRFEQNVKCQEIAKRYETDNNLPKHAVLLLKTAYSPTRNSCVAEVMKIGNGSIDYTLEDLLSGDSRIVFHRSIQNDDSKELLGDQKLYSEYDAQFSTFAR
jgi:hypothetical protein